jgi:hypothetical protein
MLLPTKQQMIRSLGFKLTLLAASACSLPLHQGERPDSRTGRGTTRANPPRPDGTVTSGGGLLYGAKANPWFLAGQANPTWCMDINTSHFSLEKDRVESILSEAIYAWGSVAGITFERKDCSASTDLVFLFGELQPKSRQSLKHAGYASDTDIRSAAAVTVKTAYDTAALRGKGFIYVAADRGPLAIAGAKVAQTPWSRLDGKLLTATLLHEIGHVMGLQHNAEGDGLMGARTIEYMLDRDSVSAVEQDPAAKASFDSYMESISPASLVDFAAESRFERCNASLCTRLVLTRRENKSFLLDIWQAPAATRTFWSDAGFTLTGSAEVTERSSEQIAISRIFANDEYKPGILAKKSRFTGSLVNNSSANDDGARPATVVWSAGKAPQVSIFDGAEIRSIFE